MNKPSLIAIDDAERQVSTILRYAEQLGFQCEFSSSISDGKDKWQAKHGFDVVVLDLNLAGEGEGFDFVSNTTQFPGVHQSTIFVYSGFVDKFKAALGVLFQLGLIQAFDKGDHRQEQKLKDALKSRYEELIARPGRDPVVASPQLKQLHDELPLIATSGLSVIITGDTGSGKEHVARRIAEISGRNQELTRTVNCAAFAETLLMSELFGHVKGSFTGADSHRLGLVLEASGYEHDGTKGNEMTGKGFGSRREVKEYVKWLSGKKGTAPSKVKASNGEWCWALPERTSGGTLILDEVAELAPVAQAALLRVLDGLPTKPVGHDGLGFLPNLRIIAVTNDIDKLDQKFRTDLLGRLNEWHVHVASIKDRPDDARAIVNQTAREVECRDNVASLTKGCFEVSEDAMNNVFLKRLGDLQGGIRELKSWTRRACIFAQRDQKPAISEQHAKAAWERSFRIAGHALNETNEEKQASHVNEDEIIQQVRALIPNLNQNFAFADFISVVTKLNDPTKREVAKFLWPLADKARSSRAQRLELFKALRHKGWNKATNTITDNDLAKIPNRLSKAGLKNPFSRRSGVTGAQGAGSLD
jgi:DNA-binding NtrC family response regulator